MGAIETNYFDRQVKGNQLASLNDEDYEVKIWDVNAEDIHYQLNQHQGLVNDFAYSQDGKYFATAGDDGKIIIYDVKNQYRVVRTLMTNEDKKRERLGWPTGEVKVIAFNPSGTALSALHETSFNQASLLLWNLNGLQN
jgi:WD40 repeat protein